MTRRAGRLVLAVVAAVVMATLAFAQVGGGQREAPPPGGEGRMPRGDRAQRTDLMDRLLERMNLSAPEKASVEAAVQEKLQGQRELRDGLAKLDAVARGAGAADREVQSAVNEYLALRDRVARRGAERDAGLLKRLSPRAQAQLLNAGVIDNGLLRGAMGMGGGGGRGGSGGGMPRRGGGAPGGGMRGGQNAPAPR